MEPLSPAPSDCVFGLKKILKSFTSRRVATQACVVTLRFKSQIFFEKRSWTVYCVPPSEVIVSDTWLHISPISPWLLLPLSYQASGEAMAVPIPTSASVMPSPISCDADEQ